MRKQIFIYSLIVMFVVTNDIWSQDTIKPINVEYGKSKTVYAKKTVQALSENNELEIAKNYEQLAKDFDGKGNKPKAEEYLKKAQGIYAKSNQSKKLNIVSRSLAKNQEDQSEFDDAKINYQIAGKNAANAVEEKLNANDYKRLENNASPATQESLIDENIKLADKAISKQDVADSYIQKAEIQSTTSNVLGAVSSYNNAILYSTKAEEVIEIKTKIANIYASKGNFDQAIAINKKLIVDAEKAKDFNTQITQLQSLANVYLKKNESENAIISLKKSYQIASQSGNIVEVKNSLNQLLNYYKTNNNQKESMLLYDDFVKNFDQIIQKDSSLIDSRNFQVIEEKILQLEKEKSLTDELISKKNKFNYFLIFAVLILLILFGLIVKALFAIKKKNKKIALQSLRREMNPHFIFNSLNSVNQFISENNELEANKYLTSYSNLMRTTMENSNKDFIVLSLEIEQLTKYLKLEHLRFLDKFDFEISVDDAIDVETTLIPNMILQPHLENAIWHGLRYLENKGFLSLKFELRNKKIAILINDNGIGLTKSQELKTRNQLTHKSVGLENTKQRISLLNDLYKTEISFKINEKKLTESGTIVEIVFPIINQNFKQPNL